MKIYLAQWSDHESLFYGRDEREVRVQARLLYGYDALNKRTCNVRPATVEDGLRLKSRVLRFDWFLGQQKRKHQPAGALSGDLAPNQTEVLCSIEN